MKKKEDRYELTLKGLISIKIDDEAAEEILDSIELYMRRLGYNAIILNAPGEFVFAKAEREEK